jgi:hypothetical protein
LDVNRRWPAAAVLSLAACFALERARFSPEPAQDEGFRREVSARAQQRVRVPRLLLAQPWTLARPARRR